MRTRYASAMLAFILLVACNRNGNEGITFSIDIDAIGQQYSQELLQSASRMLRRRVIAIAAQQDIQMQETDVQVEEDGTNLTVQISDEDMRQQLATEMRDPFTMQFMEEVPLDMAEVIVAETQGFKSIPLTEEDIAWLHIAHQDENGAQVLITFTENGAAQKRELFAERIEQNIGIFVRGMPVYKMLVESDDAEEDTLTINIPHAELAEVFVDDVNVGLRTTFSVVE
ncbi:hypothetical protein GX553_02845 [Candidatus Peribacteria bacterium]|nr:hypothetical protein [Candidatus Peribacteria bacterium]